MHKSHYDPLKVRLPSPLDPALGAPTAAPSSAVMGMVLAVGLVTTFYHPAISRRLYPRSSTDFKISVLQHKLLLKQLAQFTKRHRRIWMYCLPVNKLWPFWVNSSKNALTKHNEGNLERGLSLWTAEQDDSRARTWTFRTTWKSSEVKSWIVCASSCFFWSVWLLMFLCKDLSRIFDRHSINCFCG